VRTVVTGRPEPSPRGKAGVAASPVRGRRGGHTNRAVGSVCSAAARTAATASASGSASGSAGPYKRRRERATTGPTGKGWRWSWSWSWSGRGRAGDSLARGARQLIFAAESRRGGAGASRRQQRPEPRRARSVGEAEGPPPTRPTPPTPPTHQPTNFTNSTKPTNPPSHQPEGCCIKCR